MAAYDTFHGKKELNKRELILSGSTHHGNTLRKHCSFPSPSTVTLTSTNRHVFEGTGWNCDALIWGNVLWNLYCISICSISMLWMWVFYGFLWCVSGWICEGLFQSRRDTFNCCFLNQVLVISRAIVDWLTDLQVYFPGKEDLSFMSLWPHPHYLTILITFKWLFPIFNDCGSINA